MLIQGETVIFTTTGSAYTDWDGNRVEGKTKRYRIAGCVFDPTTPRHDLGEKDYLSVSAEEANLYLPFIWDVPKPGDMVELRGEDDWEVAAEPFDLRSAFGTGREMTVVPIRRMEADDW